MHCIRDAQTGIVLVARVERADRLGVRAARGLLGRPGLADDHGLLLGDPLGCIHTCGMRFPIDLVLIDRTLTIIRVDHAVPPWRLRWCPRARWQLEVGAGRAVAAGLEPGRRIAITADSARAGGRDPGESPPAPRESGDPAHDARDRPCERPPQLPSVAARPGHGAPPERRTIAPHPAPIDTKEHHR